MTVKELIEALQKMPQNTEVFVWGDVEGGLNPIMRVENIDVPYIVEDGQEVDCMETILLTYSDIQEEEEEKMNRFPPEDEETNQYNVN